MLNTTNNRTRALWLCTYHAVRAKGKKSPCGTWRCRVLPRVDEKIFLREARLSKGGGCSPSSSWRTKAISSASSHVHVDVLLDDEESSTAASSIRGPLRFFNMMKRRCCGFMRISVLRSNSHFTLTRFPSDKEQERAEEKSPHANFVSRATRMWNLNDKPRAHLNI